MAIRTSHYTQLVCSVSDKLPCGLLQAGCIVHTKSNLLMSAVKVHCRNTDLNSAAVSPSGCRHLQDDCQADWMHQFLFIYIVLPCSLSLSMGINSCHFSQLKFRSSHCSQNIVQHEIRMVLSERALGHSCRLP